MNEKFFRICKISTTSLMSLVEDILDLAKIEAGTFSLNEQPFSIRSLVQDIEYVFEFQCAQKGIYFNVEADRRVLDETFCSDVGRIKQVLNNLISNAFKFTLQGGITFKILSKSAFDSDSFERVRYLCFEIIDTGVGVDKKEIPKLFKMFGMARKNQNKLNSKGTGLGLTISKKLVESLGDFGTHVKFTIKEVNTLRIENNEESKEIERQNKSFEYFRSELPILSDEDTHINKLNIFEKHISNHEILHPKTNKM